MGKLLLSLCLILCAGLFSVASAQEPPPPQPPAPKQAPQKPDQKAEKAVDKAAAKARVWDVVSIDQSKNEIVVKDDSGAETHLLISATTKITREGNAAAIGDVKAGDKLTFECEGATDNCKAKLIQITPPPPDK
jgi:hypothetical protein